MAQIHADDSLLLSLLGGPCDIPEVPGRSPGEEQGRNYRILYLGHCA